MEPPEWSAPNGNDDSELVTETGWSQFKKVAVDAIPVFESIDDLMDAMDALQIAYDPADEEEILDKLEKYASNKADKSIAEQEADLILNGDKEQPELPK